MRLRLASRRRRLSMHGRSRELLANPERLASLIAVKRLGHRGMRLRPRQTICFPPPWGLIVQ